VKFACLSATNNLLRSRGASPVATFWLGLVMLAFAAAISLWHRRYGRIWQQFRAKEWEQVSGRFDEGDIVEMTASGTKRITGYQVWLGYDYEAEGEQVGVYTLPFFGEFPDRDAVEKCRMRVANRAIIVRVSRRNAKHSCVLDEDVAPYLDNEP